MAITIVGRMYTPEESATGERDIVHPETETDAVINVSTGKKLSEWMEDIDDKTRDATIQNSGLLTAEDKQKYDDILNEKTYIQETQPVMSGCGCTWIKTLRTEN